MSGRMPYRCDIWRVFVYQGVIARELRSLKEAQAERAGPTLAAESALARDWLTPEEDAAWASL